MAWSGPESLVLEANLPDQAGNEKQEEGWAMTNKDSSRACPYAGWASRWIGIEGRSICQRKLWAVSARSGGGLLYSSAET
jgi:hypothetical protein